MSKKDDDEEKAFIAEISKTAMEEIIDSSIDKYNELCVFDDAHELYEQLAEDVLGLVELGIRDQDPRIKQYVLEKFQDEFRFWID